MNARALSIRPKKTEIPGGKSNGTEIFNKKVKKIVVYLSRLFSFSENSGTTEIEWIALLAFDVNRCNINSNNLPAHARRLLNTS